MHHFGLLLHDVVDLVVARVRQHLVERTLHVACSLNLIQLDEVVVGLN